MWGFRRNNSCRHLTCRCRVFTERMPELVAPQARKTRRLITALQASMVAATPVRLEETLETGHTPVLTEPVGLAKAIE